MDFKKLVDKETAEYIQSGRKISEETETSLTEYAKDIAEKIDSGEILEWNQVDIVNAYIKLSGPTLTNKKALSLRVKLLKTPKKLLIGTLRTAIKLNLC